MYKGSKLHVLTHPFIYTYLCTRTYISLCSQYEHTWFYCKPTFYLLPVMYQINGQEAGMQPRTLCQVWKPSQHWKKTPWAAKTNYDERVGKGSDSELSCRACVKAFKFPVRGQRLSLLKLLRSTWGMFNSNAVGQKEMLCFHSQSHCLWTKSCTAFGIDVEYPMDRMVFYSYPRLRWSCPSTHCVSSTPFNRWT